MMIRQISEVDMLLACPLNDLVRSGKNHKGRESSGSSDGTSTTELRSAVCTTRIQSDSLWSMTTIAAVIDWCVGPENMWMRR